MPLGFDHRAARRRPCSPELKEFHRVVGVVDAAVIRGAPPRSLPPARNRPSVHAPQSGDTSVPASDRHSLESSIDRAREQTDSSPRVSHRAIRSRPGT